jgi:hypothetical protein
MIVVYVKMHFLNEYFWKKIYDSFPIGIDITDYIAQASSKKSGFRFCFVLSSKEQSQQVVSDNEHYNVPKTS